MARSSAGIVVAYCLVILVVLLGALYAYYAFRKYRETLTAAMMRRHERDLERGDRLVNTEDYWIRTDPNAVPEEGQPRKAKPVPFANRVHKAVSVGP